MTRTFPRPLRRFYDVWQLHPPVRVVVGAPRSLCMSTLITAAQPSQHRLHMRDAFRDGRRYAVQPTNDGFRITSETSTRRNGRRFRTRPAATVTGTFSGDDRVTFIRLRYQIHWLHMISGLLIPAFIASILVYVPWSPALITVIIAAIFALAFVVQRMEAALQVGEMVFFIEKAFEDFPPANVPELDSSVPGVVMKSKRDFHDEWQRFYEERLKEEAGE